MNPSPSALLPVRLWIFFCTGLGVAGWGLSLIQQLNALGYAVVLLVMIGVRWWVWKRPIFSWKWSGKLLRRLRNPFCALFVLFCLCQLLGGLIYPPTNYDGLSYRVPRVLHWLAEDRWHWIGGWNTRMDYSGVGFEWLSAPILAITKSDRLLFLPNIIAFALLPGLVFCAFRELGIASRVARYWMWILPSGYCFVLQAGSIGNDSFAVVYVLSALLFAQRAGRTGRAGDLWLALLAMGLFTGAKASSLPLLLPCLCCLGPALRAIRWSRGVVVGTIIIALLSGVVSFLPLAIINSQQAGDWAGDPTNASRMKLSSPVSGLTGNALQLLARNLQLPVLPGAETVNARLEPFFQTDLMLKVVRDFPRLSLKFNDLSAEESAGAGLGILFLGGVFGLLAVFQIAKTPAVWKNLREKRVGLLVGVTSWLALIAFMAGLGSEAVPRIAAPYYPLLLILPSLLAPPGFLVRNRGWLALSFLAAGSVLPAVVLSPARPLLPVRSLVAALAGNPKIAAKIQRVETVYRVYRQRSDSLAAVRNELPPNARRIGFAGTADESEISFWRPFGRGAVQDLQPVLADRLPDLTQMDALVTSDWGCSDRFGRTPEKLAEAVGWRVAKSVSVQSLASAAPMRWAILLPK